MCASFLEDNKGKEGYQGEVRAFPDLRLFREEEDRRVRKETFLLFASCLPQSN